MVFAPAPGLYLALTWLFLRPFSIILSIVVSIHDIISTMQEWAPDDTAETWDRVGLQVHTNRTIQRMALALELNLDTWDIIADRDYDLILTHHPLIFHPLATIRHDDWTHAVLRQLIQQDTGLYVSHTNLDRAIDGVSHVLLSQYALNIDCVSDIANGFGKIARLNVPVSLSSLESAIPILAKVIPNDLTIQSVAVCGGSGRSLIQDVVAQSVDIYITGELGYHDIQYLRQQHVGVILLGHYQSEVFILEAMQSRLAHLPIEIDMIR